MTNGKMGAAVKRFAVRPGRKLPKWLWIAIAASLGVETGAVRRRFVAVVLHLVTVVSALGTAPFPMNKTESSRFFGPYKNS